MCAQNAQQQQQQPKFLSPEEYKTDQETNMIEFLMSKINVWAFQSLVYEMLTGGSVWNTVSEAEILQ